MRSIWKCASLCSVHATMERAADWSALCRDMLLAAGFSATRICLGAFVGMPSPESGEFARIWFLWRSIWREASSGK